MKKVKRTLAAALAAAMETLKIALAPNLAWPT